MTKANYFGVSTALSVMVVLLFGLLIITVTARPAHAAATFTVNSTGDENDLDFPGGTFDGSSDGKCFTGDILVIGEKCTLRAAIQQANRSSGADTINFDIPTTGVATISPGSQLPAITQRVTIDGYTQRPCSSNPASCSKPNTIPLAKDGTNAILKIELDGASSGLTNGLQLSGPGASNSVIRGLVINNDFFFGIDLSGGTGHKVEGNFIGTDTSGTSAGPGNNDGVTMDTSNSTLGGTSPDKRNIISGNVSHGIQVGGEGGNKVQGNLIGTKANGTEALGNGVSSGGDGVAVFSSSNTIGDSDPSDGATNAANTIAFNTFSGVGISGTGNRILSNSIFSNNRLGINLHGLPEDANFVTANDPKDLDTGANGQQNYPEKISATTFPMGTSIRGTLDSTPSTRHKKRTFIIQFFTSPAADSPSGYGEGKTFLGQIQVKIDRQGKASFGFVPSDKVAVGQFISATATNKAKGDTSEFSQATVVEEPAIGP